MSKPDLGEKSPQKDIAVLEKEAEEKELETPEEDDNEDSSDEKTGQDDDESTDGSQTDEADSEDGEEGQDPEVQRKEIQEKLLEYDKPLENKRAQLKEDWDDIEAAHEQIKRQITNPIKTTTGEVVYLLPDDQFEALEDYIIEQGDAGKLATLKQARAERREYLKLTAPLNSKFQKTHSERVKQTLEDVGHIKEALKEITPEYEKHFQEIEDLLQDEFKANPIKMERFMWGGIRDKFRMVDRLLDESGIKQRVEKEIRIKERPNLATLVGAGKGKRSTPTGNSKQRIYTRQEIKAMSPAQYDRLEKDIDRALVEGRIK